MYSAERRASTPLMLVHVSGASASGVPRIRSMLAVQNWIERRRGAPATVDGGSWVYRGRRPLHLAWVTWSPSATATMRTSARPAPPCRRISSSCVSSMRHGAAQTTRADRG